MDKAIKLIKALLEPDADDRMSFDDSAILAGHKGSREWVYAAEALAELQAHKAKIEEIATDLQNISQYLKDEVHPRCEYDLYSRLEDLNGAVLQKLEELDK